MDRKGCLTSRGVMSDQVRLAGRARNRHVVALVFSPPVAVPAHCARSSPRLATFLSQHLPACPPGCG